MSARFAGRFFAGRTPSHARSQPHHHPYLTLPIKGRESKARRRCAGFSVIEVALVVTMLSILLGMIVVFLQGMLSAQHAGGERLAMGQSMMRLADQFRQDVHAASNAPPQGTAIELIGPDGANTTYAVKEKQLIRESRLAGSHANVRREEFEIPAGAAVTFSTAAPTIAAQFVTLAIDASPTPQKRLSAWRATRVEAQLGRDHRWNAPKQESSTD